MQSQNKNEGNLQLTIMKRKAKTKESRKKLAFILAIKEKDQVI